MSFFFTVIVDHLIVHHQPNRYDTPLTCNHNSDEPWINTYVCYFCVSCEFYVVLMCGLFDVCACLECVCVDPLIRVAS